MPFKSKAQAPVENHNKTYLECKVEVNTVMKPDGYGGEKLRYHTGEIIKTMKKISVEPKRATQLNRTWESRLVLYWPEDKPLATSIKRTPIEDEYGLPTWHDDPWYE